MKRIHYLLLGLLVSLTIAAVSPTLPPTRIIAGNSTVVVVTNGVNNFTLTASGGVGTSNGLATNLTVYSSGAAAPLIVNTNQLIVTNGLVGIGTVPTSTLHINGSLKWSGSSASSFLDINSSASRTLVWQGNSSGSAYQVNYFNIQPVSSLGTAFTTAVGSPIMYVLATGNVGIGIVAPTERLHVVGNALIATNLTANDLSLSKTITAPATTGNQTINKAAGRVNIAAAGTTVVVTCSLVTANSIIIAVAATDDATAMVTSVVPAAGSFTINTVATTDETAFNFLIVN